MRNLFIPLAKLLGVHTVIMILRNISRLPRTLRSSSTTADVLGLVVYHLCLVGIALLLLFGTRKLAGIVRIPEVPSAPPPLSASALLRVGLVLIGFLMLARTIPALLGGFLTMLTFGDLTSNYAPQRLAMRSLAPQLLAETAGGMALILASRKIADLLAGPRNKHNH